MTKQPAKTIVKLCTQAQYDLWLASSPDFSAVTYFRAYDLPLVTALPDMPAVTDFVAYDLPLVTALPDMPAVTYFRADKHITELRKS